MAESKEPTEKVAATSDQTTEAHEKEVQTASAEAAADSPPEVASSSSHDGRDEELEQLRRRIQEQDQRWEHTTRLLSDIAQRQTPQSTDPTEGSGYTTQVIIAVAAIVLIGVGAFVYSRNGQPQPSAPMVASHDSAPAALHPEVPAQPQPPAAQVAPPAAFASQREASKLPNSNQSAPPAPEAKVESAPEASQQPPPPPKAVETTLNGDLSKRLSDYLHSHKLPYVDAVVFATPGGTPKSVELSGQVRTFIGKEHAATFAKGFFPSRIALKNRIEISPTLASRTTAPAAGAESSAPTGEACTSSCQNEQVACAGKCRTDAASAAGSNVPAALGGASGAIGKGIGGLLGQLGQAGVELKQCTDGCEQTLNQCVGGCGQSAGVEAQSAPEAPPPSDTAPPSAEGPDSPPE